MTKRKNPLIIVAIKWVLGEDFMDNVDHYRVNSDICSRFVASLLGVETSGYKASGLTRALFSRDYLGGLEEVVAYYIPFRCLPLATDLQRFITSKEEVPWHPLIDGLRTTTLSAHRLRTELATEFLLRIYLIIPISASTDWYTGFEDYIFSWVLTLDILPDLVLIITVESSGIASDKEWSREEDAKDDTEDYDSLMEEKEDEDDSIAT